MRWWPMARLVPILFGAAVAVVLARQPHASTVTLVRQPALQKVSATSATVTWSSREPGVGQVRFRRRDGDPWSIADASTRLYTRAETAMAADYYQHEATLSGLVPATAYTYDVLVGGAIATSSTDRFNTAPPPGTGSIAFVAFGDSGTGGNEQRRLADLMIADSAANLWDLAIHTGDVVYPGGTYKALHEKFFAIYEPWLRRRPVFFAFGNHEEYAQKGKPYFDLFALPENGASEAFPNHRERYYSFDYGPVHFIALDSQLTSAGGQFQAQLNWLAQDLETTVQPWRVAFIHRPAFGSGWTSPDIMFSFRPLFERYGVHLVLQGHEHDYARSAPWREGTASNAAVMYVVTGGGGAGLNTPSPGPWLASWASAFHYLRVAVTDCAEPSSCEMALEAIGEDGLAFDSFTLPLRSQQRDAAPPEAVWVAPLEGATVAGITTVAAEGADDEQIVKMDLWIDGALAMVDTAPPYEWAWDTREDLNGAHELELRATDINGRQGRSPVRLVHVNNTKPLVRVLSPERNDAAFTDMPYTISWIASEGGSPFQRFDVESSADGGRTYGPIAECVGLPRHARECVWSHPGPVSKKTVIRVSAIDAAGRSATDESRDFSVKAGTAQLTLRSATKPTRWGIGSHQSILWSSGLGIGAVFRVELSRDGGDSWITLASRLRHPSEMLWTVTGPATSGGLLRLTWLSGPLTDTSDALIRIEDRVLTLNGPPSGTVWPCGERVKARWTTNLGLRDRLNVKMSVDGGATFPIVLAASIPATQGGVHITVPDVASTSVRLRVEALDNPDWNATSVASFTIGCGT